MSRKRGKLSTEEENFILQFKDKISIEEIANKLNRTEEPILKYITEKASSSYKGMSREDSTDAELKTKLHKRKYWTEVTKQFTKDELEYFENMWIDFMKAFREDLLIPEELELKQWITLDILANRSMKERKRNIEDIDRFQKMVDNEYKKEVTDRDPSLPMWEHQLNFCRSAIKNHTDEQQKLNNQIKIIKDGLKAARADRISKVENGRQTFTGLLKMLDDEEQREQEGNEAAIISIAAEKAKVKFGGYHKYLDDKFDRPILNCDTVFQDDNIEEGEEDDKAQSEQE